MAHTESRRPLKKSLLKLTNSVGVLKQIKMVTNSVLFCRDSWRFPFSQNFRSNRFEVQMAHVVQMEILRNKRMTIGGTPPFHSNRMERKFSIVPFLLFVNLLALPPTSYAITIYQWDCKFFALIKKAFPFHTENFRNFKPKILSRSIIRRKSIIIIPFANYIICKEICWVGLIGELAL